MIVVFFQLTANITVYYFLIVMLPEFKDLTSFSTPDVG